MKLESHPVTGKESKEGLTPMLQALSEFYEALNTRDIDKMAQNWLQTDEAVMDNPLGGIRRGWNDIKTVYEALFNSAATFYFEFYDYSLHAAGELFYVVGRERGKFQKGETSLDLAIRTSRIFKLENGRWQQVHHHGSIDDPDLLSGYRRAVMGD